MKRSGMILMVMAVIVFVGCRSKTKEKALEAFIKEHLKTVEPLIKEMNLAYFPSYPYYSAPPVVVQPGPTTYIQQEPAAPAQDYWYYCKDAGAYYPYVKECPGGWMQVVPSPSPPGR